MKEKVSISRANRLVNHGSVVLASSRHEEKRSIITLAWQMPVSHSPMLLAIAVGKTRFSHELISRSREFVINVPSWNLLDKVMYCGTNSGRDVDKFKECGFTPLPGEKVRAPLIQECFAHIECRLRNEYEAGDHTIFVGEALAALVDDGILRDGGVDPGRVKTLHHLGGAHFAWLCRQEI